MIRAKNYKTELKFVKVMPRILVASFFAGHGVDYVVGARRQDNAWCPRPHFQTV